MTVDFPTNEIRSLYNTFRNRLRNLGLEETLAVIWAYMRFLQFNTPIPSDIEVDDSFLKHVHPSVVMSEWSFMLIAQEAILHADHLPKPRKSIKYWGALADVGNSLKALVNEIAGEFVNSDNIKSEIFRIAHLQFPWQSKANNIKAARYLKIFSHKPLENIFISKFGFDLRKLYAMGYMVLGSSMKNPAKKLPIDCSEVGIARSEVDSFLDLFCIELLDLKEEILSNRVFNELFEYRYNPLIAHPIIRMSYHGEDCLVYLSGRMIFDKFTSGIYYDLCDEPGFDEAWGKAFENYIGDVINVVNKDGKWKVYDDFDDRTGNTADWLLLDGESVVFVECKTKRLTLSSKTTLGQNTALESDREKLIKAISQAYYALKRYLDGDYPGVAYNKKLLPFVVITMLEDWYSFLIKDGCLDEDIRAKLAERGIPDDFIEKYPYFICSTGELEKLLQIAKVQGFNDVFMNKIVDCEYKTWSMAVYLENQYASTMKKLKPLFPDFLDEVVDMVKGR